MRILQTKGVHRKKQESMNALFGRLETSKLIEARPVKVYYGYRYQLSIPIDIPPWPPTPSPAYRDPHFPAIQENHFQILTMCAGLFDARTVIISGISVRGLRMTGSCL